MTSAVSPGTGSPGSPGSLGSLATGATGPGAPVDLLVDWELAARTAARLSGGGPTMATREAQAVVAELRAAAVRSQDFVATTAQLHAPGGLPALVIDRAGWSRANAFAMRELIAPAVAEAMARHHNQPSAPVAAVGKRVTALEVGSLMGFLASKILGQYDAFTPGGGRLLLVAPNLVAAEREMDVDPSDFRLWVCLHEETHRVQFGANPWLADYLQGRIRALASDVFGQRDLSTRLREASAGISELVRGTTGDQPGAATSLVDLLQTPEQRAAMAELTAIMSLLEGHADVVMDAVGPDVVPTVAIIREKFERRREGRGSLDRLLRRLLGLDAKMRQYSEGAAFVRGVQREVGIEGFNAIWSSPETLPRPGEIADPASWVRRVHGPAH